MSKDELLQIIAGLLDSDYDLSFLTKLDESDLKTLVSCIREWIDSNNRKY
jgi:hypothetical protein